MACHLGVIQKKLPDLANILDPVAERLEELKVPISKLELAKRLTVVSA